MYISYFALVLSIQSFVTEKLNPMHYIRKLNDIWIKKLFTAATGVQKKATHGCDIGRQWCIDGRCISQEGLKADNVENPVFFPPNLEISVALGIYQVQKDIGPAPQISRKEASCMDGVVHGDAYVSRTRRETTLRGL